jgi:plastocyanin
LEPGHRHRRHPDSDGGGCANLRIGSGTRHKTRGDSGKIDNFIFSPNPITVAAGTTIRWTNRDDIPHNVVSDDKSFKSKVLDTDETFAYTFAKPGTYTYFCSIHPKMTGKVVVQ